MIFSSKNIERAAYVRCNEVCKHRMAATHKKVLKGSVQCQNCAFAYTRLNDKGAIKVKCLANIIEREQLETYRAILDMWRQQA